MLNQNIVLIGFRGAGKSTFGQEIARQLDLPFADLDNEIEFVTGMSIPEYTDKYGWQQFREIEQKVAHDFCRNFSGIIASGGGTIENSKNLQNLKKTGKFIFLNPDFSQVRKYLLKDKTRPRLNPDIPLHQEIDQAWEQRKGIYGATADIEVHPDIKGDIAEESKKIIAAIPPNLLPKPPKARKIAVFSSSNGSTLQGIIDAQAKGRIPNVTIDLFVTDKKDSGALEKAKAAGIENIEVIEPQKGETREEYDREIINLLREFKPEWVLLAGWMRIFSKVYCDQFGDITLNVHPSLLPKFAGLKGDEVHQQVLEYEEKYTGATIHRITAEVDAGESVLQRKVLVDEDDDVESLRYKVQKQEILGFCEILEKR